MALDRGIGPVEDTLRRLDGIICTSQLKGYDPYDILNSELLLAFTRQSHWVGVLLTQMFRFLPVNLRRFIGIPRLVNAKTTALLARAYLKLYRHSAAPYDSQQARLCLDWLAQHGSPSFANACWGYSFPWCTVRQFLEKDAPSVVCTAFVAHALLDAYEAFNDQNYLLSARSACDFILDDCPRITGDGSFCFSYSPFANLPVHNANLLGVSVLARVYRYTQEGKLLTVAQQALDYTLNDQNTDGSWYYHGPYSGRDGTTDNFHTGFVLESLRQIQRDTGCDLTKAIHNGQRFYEQRFFDNDGTPRRKLDSQYPIDIRDAAQLFVVLGQSGQLTAEQRDLLDRVLFWTLKNMRDRSGYFYFVRWKFGARSPLYLRWQAWMLWGLANILPLYRTSAA